MMVFICANREEDTLSGVQKAMDYAKYVHSQGLVPCVTLPLLWQWEPGQEALETLCEEAIACCDEVWTFEAPDGDVSRLMRFAKALRMPVCRATLKGRRDYVFNRDLVRQGGRR